MAAQSCITAPGGLRTQIRPLEMDQIYRPALQRELRVQNQREDRDLQHKLLMLHKQHRHTCKMLQRRRDSLMKEQRRTLMVKACEPIATVDVALREIGEHRNGETHFRGSHTSTGRRLKSRKSRHHDRDSGQMEQSRSASAPASSVEPTGPVRHRGNIQSNLSLRQMKNIAAIDSISEKEAARQRQKAREETERLRQLQREVLHKRVTTFIQSLRDKGNKQKNVEAA